MSDEVLCDCSFGCLSSFWVVIGAVLVVLVSILLDLAFFRGTVSLGMGE